MPGDARCGPTTARSRIPEQQSASQTDTSIVADPADTLRALVFSDATPPDTGACPDRCPWCDGWPAW